MVEFVAAVAKVQTLVDGGLRLTLDLPETAVMEAAQLMEFKRLGVALRIEVTPEQENDRESQGKSRKIHI